MKKGWCWYDIFFVALLLYLFVLQIQAIWPFTIDDMYISLRYARNWAEGNGLLWNIHSPPVEGYSNFSFVVLGALSLILHINPVIALKGAGVIGLFFTCFFTYLITRFWFERRESLLPVIFILLYKGQIIWAASGLETAVYEALLCGAVYFAFCAMGYSSFPDSRSQSRSVYFVVAALMLSLAGMTRPEAPAFMALFFFLMCWDRPQANTKEYWQGIGLFVLTLLLTFLPYFLWRWHYYGHLFPNSVYCKGFSNFATILDQSYLKFIWPFALLGLIACLRTHDKRYYFLWLPSLVYLVTLIGADPIVAFDNRLFLPAFVLLLPLSLQGLAEVILWFVKDRNSVFIMALYVTSFCLAFFFIPVSSLNDYHYFKKNPLAGEQLRNNVVQWLTSFTKPGDTVVLSDAGLIPYQSHLNFIDSYCLNNPTMTQYPKEQMYEAFCRQVLLDKPQVVILTSLLSHGKITYAPSDNCLKLLINSQKSYKLNTIFSTTSPESTYRYELFTNIPNF